LLADYCHYFLGVPTRGDVYDAARIHYRRFIAEQSLAPGQTLSQVR
jgi:hypothetical protein